VGNELGPSVGASDGNIVGKPVGFDVMFVTWRGTSEKAEGRNRLKTAPTNKCSPRKTHSCD